MVIRSPSIGLIGSNAPHTGEWNRCGRWACPCRSGHRSCRRPSNLLRGHRFAFPEIALFLNDSSPKKYATSFQCGTYNPLLRKSLNNGSASSARENREGNEGTRYSVKAWTVSGQTMPHVRVDGLSTCRSGFGLQTVTGERQRSIEPVGQPRTRRARNAPHQLAHRLRTHWDGCDDRRVL
jgi:hypothetical protein